jgi:hypothetical protein
MPEIRDRHYFLPDENFTKDWLSTRKPGYTVATNTHRPGAFETSSFEKDRAWFFFGAIIEILAISITVLGGINKGEIYLIAAVVAVIFFVILDYFGAKLHHRRQAAILRLQNEKVVTDSVSHPEIDRLIQSKKGTVILGLVLILISAFLKLVALFFITTLPIIFYAIFSLLYILVVYIHLKHTGFYFAEIAASKTLSKQHQAFAQSYLQFQQAGEIDPTVLRYVKQKIGVSVVFDTDVSITFDDGDVITFGEDYLSKGEPHKLEKIGEGKYKLTAHGLLIDKDIKNLCSGQDPKAQDVLSKKAITLQLSQIPTNL